MGSIAPAANTAAVNGGSKKRYEYEDRLLFQPRPIDVIIIGAGLTGIAAVKLFKDRFKDKPVKFRIYEKNADVCGTWFENRYPG